MAYNNTKNGDSVKCRSPYPFRYPLFSRPLPHRPDTRHNKFSHFLLCDSGKYPEDCAIPPNFQELL